MSAIPSWCRVGAKVVSIVDTGWFDDGNGDDCCGPLKGEVCTIAAIDPDPEGIALVQLAEYLDDGENYDLRGFRPLITLETDIATHFRQHLDVREPVEA